MSLKDRLPDRLPLLADLLMDAAYADDHLEGEEKMAVKRLLREILDAQTLPMDLDFRIDEFDPQKFDRAKTLGAFASDSKELKKRLIELVAAVHASDGEIDFAEDAQLRVGRRGARPAAGGVSGAGGRHRRGDRSRRGSGSPQVRRIAAARVARLAHHLALRAISSAFWGHQLPAAGPWLQRPSDSPGGLSQ